MDNEIDEPTFLRDLVKVSRQKVHQVKWVDRDGTDRITRLSKPEHARLDAIARARGTSMAEVMRQASHVPVTPRGATGGPRPAED
ncbi:MAG: ribbon-helix-helix protein, CopG family [Nibricoccus sp.]